MRSCYYYYTLKLLGLNSLEVQRLEFDLKLYFQVIHGLLNLESTKFFQILPVTHETRSQFSKSKTGLSQ